MESTRNLYLLKSTSIVKNCIMKKNILFTLLSVVLLLPLTFTESAEAQWAVGASYEVRDEDPTNGFGARVERSILSAVPVVDLGLRAHFSYFNETNEAGSGNLTIDRTFESYDIGLAATGGVNVGLVKPYVGLGIGWDNSSLEYSEDIGGTGVDFQEQFETDDLYWNGFVGAEVTLLPVINPFIEYRFTKISGRDNIELENVSRLALGVSLRF